MQHLILRLIDLSRSLYHPVTAGILRSGVSGGISGRVKRESEVSPETINSHGGDRNVEMLHNKSKVLYRSKRGGEWRYRCLPKGKICFEVHTRSSLTGLGGGGPEGARGTG